MTAPTARIVPIVMVCPARVAGSTTSRPPYNDWLADFLEFLESYDCMILEHILPEWSGVTAATIASAQFNA